MIDGLNKRCTELEGQIIYLHKEQENSLIRRAKKLCGQQDIKSKILKKLIMKCKTQLGRSKWNVLNKGVL